jgi:signal transduction histidine kinase
VADDAHEIIPHGQRFVGSRAFVCNLLSNALKFTPAQGSIVVRLEHVDDNVVCCVSDTGEGIPDDKLEAVFERFVQLTKNDRRGVGLGLFISKCIVQGHGGRIWVENRTGAGSTFCFSLPIDPRSGDGRQASGI